MARAPYSPRSLVSFNSRLRPSTRSSTADAVRRTLAAIGGRSLQSTPVEGQLPGTAAPSLHGGKAHIVPPRYRRRRYAGPDLSDDRASLLLPSPVCFLPIASHSHGFSPRIIE